MRYVTPVIALSTIVLSLAIATSRAADAPAAKKVAHRYLATDNRKSRVVIVSAKGTLEWEYPKTGVCNDAWMLEGGKVLLISRNAWVRLVTPDLKKGVGGQTVWEYKVPKGCEVHTSQPLPDGKILVGQCGKEPKLIELDAKGKVTREIVLKTTSRNVHGQMRQARKTPRGTYLVCMTNDSEVRELDARGKVVRTIEVKGNPFAAVLLPNDNVLISCGDGHALIEVDAKGKIVWQIGENDLPGHPLRFVAGVHRLANGNTVVANWGGHGHIGKQPHLFEVTRDKKVVWQVFDNALFKTISSVQILDSLGTASKGLLLR